MRTICWTENFEIGFDDDLEAILGADFIRMVMILPAEFEKEIEKKVMMMIVLICSQDKSACS